MGPMDPTRALMRSFQHRVVPGVESTTPPRAGRKSCGCGVWVLIPRHPLILCHLIAQRRVGLPRLPDRLNIWKQLLCHPP